MDSEKKFIKPMKDDTKILANFIESQIVKGGKKELSYAELSAAIGVKDLRLKHWGLLRTAKKNVEIANNILFRTVFNYGLALTNDYSGTFKGVRDHIRKMSKRTSSRVLNAIDADKDVSNEEKAKVYAEASISAAIVQFTKDRSYKKIAAGVVQKNSQLPLAETIEMFKT